MTVFVVQERVNADGNPIFNLTPAEHYGELTRLLGPAHHQELVPAQMLRELRSKLQHFCDQDYLLCIGGPVAIAAAVTIAGAFNRGVVPCLIWDKFSRSYVNTTLDFNGRLIKEAPNMPAL